MTLKPQIKPVIDQLTGQAETHLEEIFPGCFLHREVTEAYGQLLDLAEQAGLDLRLASAFRSFDQQLAIWNAKASGTRPVLDDHGKAMVIADLPDIDKVWAILRWSALPGASRHHWGTDIDIWDASAVPEGYRLGLVPEEYCSGGVFQNLTQWLDQLIASGASDFYRPYDDRANMPEKLDKAERRGVAPEPWHLSHRPVAEKFEQVITEDCLREVLENTDILLGQTILDNLDEIYQGFVLLKH